MKLQETEIEAALAEAEGWQREDGKWIVKKYRFSAFMDGIRFVQGVADVAEKMNHHPMIAIDYKMVTLRLTSWKAGGLTELDFAAAKAYNDLIDNH